MLRRPTRSCRDVVLVGAGALGLFAVLLGSTRASAVELKGTIVDADTDAPVAARIYIQAADGEWLFPRSASPEGTALPYTEQWVPTPGAVEKHTTLSAHPFTIDLPEGRYQVTIERGKEYLPLEQEIVVDSVPQERVFRLRRIANLSAAGWYSGETHVHRRIRELPNVMLAEDLNVAFPVTFWTTEAGTAPHLEPSRLRRQGPSPFGPRVDHGTDPIEVDATHVIVPRNTEYEIFYIDGQRHTLGALFILNHKSRFERGMPPVGEIARQAHAEGALLDLDKHSWPWSMMLVPVAEVDLYELSNNSVWRTQFGFRRAGTPIPSFMDVESDEGGLTEFGWIQFGLQNYYALLNCGFRIHPTAGTASGVHPVPLGHSRVYVQVPGEFQLDKWLEGLKQGRSFVTTGPLLLTKMNGLLSGSQIQVEPGEVAEVEVDVETISDLPLESIEILRNGEVVGTVEPRNEPQSQGGFTTKTQLTIRVDETSWLAVRCFQRQPDGRVRFAHTGPTYVQVGDQSIRPRREEVEFLLGRVRQEIERNEKVLEPKALAEFRQAESVYAALLERAERPRDAESAALSVEQTDQGVLVREGTRKVLFYQRKTKSKDGKYARAGYVHPLWHFDGTEMTEDFPGDHLHHRGIFWAWHQLYVEGRSVGDPWICDGIVWEVEHVEAKWLASGAVELHCDVAWKSNRLGQDDELQTVIRESTIVRVHPRQQDDALQKIDFEITLRAAIPGVTLGGSDDRKGYGGFSVRVPLPEDVTFRTIHGEAIPQITSVEPSPWLNISGTFGGSEKKSLAILTHPTTPGFPPRWILRKQRSMQNPVYPGRDTISLSESEPLTLRYQLLLHAGDSLDNDDFQNLLEQ